MAKRETATARTERREQIDRDAACVMTTLPERTAAERKELTPAESRVIALLARGLPNKIIAHELGITISTVERNVEKIFLKIGATNRVQAALEFHGIDWRKADA